MNNLNDSINKSFLEYKNMRKSNNCKIIFSGSNNIGEGEHKIFQYIRDNPKNHKNKTTLIYGLDEDLIVLTSFAPTNRLVVTEALSLMLTCTGGNRIHTSKLSEEGKYLWSILNV